MQIDEEFNLYQIQKEERKANIYFLRYCRPKSGFVKLEAEEKSRQERNSIMNTHVYWHFKDLNKCFLVSARSFEDMKKIVKIINKNDLINFISYANS